MAKQSPLEELHNYGRIGMFEGGNDSGFIDITGPYADSIESFVDSVLDYGSWAGDFYVSGHISIENNDLIISGVEASTEYYTMKIEVDGDFSDLKYVNSITIEENDVYFYDILNSKIETSTLKRYAKLIETELEDYETVYSSIDFDEIVFEEEKIVLPVDVTVTHEIEIYHNYSLTDIFDDES